MTAKTPNLNRMLALEMGRVTERAAVCSALWVGRGDEKSADQAAVDAMRKELNVLDIDGTVVIGEGERDEAPMLYIGEKVGTGKGPKVDIALDPLEGTTLTAKAMPNAMAVLAAAAGGTLLNAPDTYMDKIAIGGGYPEGVVDLDAGPADNIKALAKAKGVAVSEITACILDRPRHADLIRAVRETGARVTLITDGDVAGVIATTDPETGVDIYMGIGGAPEGVLAAAALRCIGGQMQGRLVTQSDEQKARAAKMGVKDFNKKFELNEMASGDVIFAATGVTDGWLLDGIHHIRGGVTTHTIVMRSATGTVRRLKSFHASPDKFK
ncbi:class II fructose-bisphosphatase [Parvibaculum sp.]|jgi:fructose-1,6-bisphosphatase II / sedoheptulose-1,7-bisphosphatase|uniref:class II fructose-bisphosphatase n=1 Tax=Parvibaculum sp. TaxID=2024848 RepID=UPI001B295005|nr:class II fructose-bisphosphatase [Parvibaculum sp.]MBO6634286.1 class II fructose-bisphosphatase [Parvibaculum sp.]MBO6680264.1 class II fructose-bisphosphatase [Parvibaculum sp.]MBO6685896.1 class II fructose-bisphosphatase [Parvibaculum sp.]MBO6905487.1 class II fructose-bisphosphatase [Parvibaculum sp.]